MTTTNTIYGNHYEYEFDLNGFPGLWSFKDKWILTIKLINGISWSEFSTRAQKEMIESVLWHEFKSIKDSAENQKGLSLMQYVDDEAWDDYFQNAIPP